MASSVEDIKTNLVADLADPAITVANVFTSRRDLDKHQAAPKIVVIMMGGPITTTEKIGHGKVAVDKRAKVVRLRKVSFEFHLHGQDMEQAEDLLHGVIRVLHNRYLTGGEFGPESWTDQQEGADSHTRNGSMVMFPYVLTYPVYDTQKTLRLLTADPPFDHDAEWGENQESIGC
jgi:hypothetical protein